MESVFANLPDWVQIAILVIPSLSTIIAALGLFNNACQMKRSSKLMSSRIITDCLRRFVDDEDIQSAFYDIEYAIFSYDPLTFHGSPSEKKVDKLLQNFASVALVWQAGLVSTQDLLPIHYYIQRIMSNQEIVSYLDFMSDWIRTNKVLNHPFSALTLLAKELESDN